MSESHIGEAMSTPENLENQYYKAFQAAMDEEERIRGEIDALLSMTENPKLARKRIVENLDPLMQEAMARSREAYEKWFDQIMKIHVG